MTSNKNIQEHVEEEFDAFFEFDTEDKSTVSSTSCKLFAEHCIGELLAANQVMREALQFYADGRHWDYNDCVTKDTYLNDKGEVAKEALSIKPGDIALVEVGSVDCQFVDGIGEHHVAEFCHLPEGVTKLYALQKKEGANVST